MLNTLPFCVQAADEHRWYKIKNMHRYCRKQYRSHDGQRNWPLHPFIILWLHGFSARFGRGLGVCHDRNLQTRFIEPRDSGGTDPTDSAYTNIIRNALTACDWHEVVRFPHFYNVTDACKSTWGPIFLYIYIYMPSYQYREGKRRSRDRLICIIKIWIPGQTSFLLKQNPVSNNMIRQSANHVHIFFYVLWHMGLAADMSIKFYLLTFLPNMLVYITMLPSAVNDTTSNCWRNCYMRVDMVFIPGSNVAPPQRLSSRSPYNKRTLTAQIKIFTSWAVFLMEWWLSELYFVGEIYI